MKFHWFPSLMAMAVLTIGHGRAGTATPPAPTPHNHGRGRAHTHAHGGSNGRVVAAAPRSHGQRRSGGGSSRGSGGIGQASGAMVRSWSKQFGADGQLDHASHLSDNDEDKALRRLEASCPSTCFGMNCDWWESLGESNSWTCAENEADGCDCSGCACDGDSESLSISCS